MRKLLFAIFRPNVWFFIGISSFSGSISFEDQYNIWLAGADSRHQQWLEQMVVELKGGKVVSSDDECFCGTRVILVQ